MPRAAYHKTQTLLIIFESFIHDTRQQWRAMQNDADRERSKSENNLHEPPWYEKRFKEMELEN